MQHERTPYDDAAEAWTGYAATKDPKDGMGVKIIPDLRTIRLSPAHWCAPELRVLRELLPAHEDDELGEHDVIVEGARGDDVPSTDYLAGHLLYRDGTGLFADPEANAARRGRLHELLPCLAACSFRLELEVASHVRPWRRRVWTIFQNGKGAEGVTLDDRERTQVMERMPMEEAARIAQLLRGLLPAGRD